MKNILKMYAGGDREMIFLEESIVSMEAFEYKNEK